MKLFGLQRIDGGITITASSGQQTLVALPDDRPQSARIVGERLLALLDDPTQPHAAQSQVRSEGDGSELEDGLAAVGEGIETTRVVWQALRLLTRGRR